MFNSPFFAEYGNDIAGVVASATLLLLYHLYLIARLRRNPAYTIQAVNSAARTAWVNHVMAEEGRAILAVQTLRNSTMAATFLASTAVLLVMGTLTLSGQSDKLVASWRVFNLLGSPLHTVWVIKLLCLLSDFFIAFFSFAMSLRLFNHVGYQINVPPAARRGIVTPHAVAVHLNRAGRYYSIGMRAYYFAVPLVFWLFGPHLMVMATLVLIAVLYHVDRTPRGEADAAATVEKSS